MLKSFCLTVLLFLASTLLIAEAAFSSPVPEGTQSPEAAKVEAPKATNLNADVPDCQVKTPDGTTVNLGSPCEKAPEVSTVRPTYRKPPHNYDIETMKKFDDKLYGKEE